MAVTIIGGSDATFVYTPEVTPDAAPTIAVYDSFGNAVTVANSVVADGTQYDFTLESTESLALLGTTCTIVWTWAYTDSDGTHDVRDVQGFSVVATRPPIAFGMTFEQMQEQTYFLMDESESSLFPRTIIKRYINQGLYEVASQVSVPMVRQSFTAPFTNSNECVLDNPILSHTSAVVSNVRLDGVRLELVDENDLYDKTTTGTPQSYWTDGGKVCLYPIPTAAVTGTVLVEYVKQPTELLMPTDTSEMPAPAQELACVWAAMKAKGKDDEFNARDRLAADFTEGIARLAGPLTGFYE